MIPEGATAPSFSLPAVVDGEVDRVALDDYLGQQVVILAFYPGDFNPACSDGATDLDELDLFTMQKDVSILACSADSVYAHRAFADEFDLHIPLLSDPRGEVASTYGVAVDDPDDGHVVNRGVVVVGLDGTVEFTWSTESLTELPPVDRIRTSVDSVGGERTAEARYGVGHAHYVEGRRQFTSAMGAFEDEGWMMARREFTEAESEFSEAADEFNTAVRFAEDAELRGYFQRAEDKAEALWQAAEWLAESADAYASGEGADGVAMREDAERPLEAARDIHDPVPPAEFPPAEDPADLETGPEDVSLLPDDEDEVDATLEIDVDDAAGPDEAVDLGPEDGPAAVDAPSDADPAGAAATGAGAADSESATGAEDAEDGDDIDEAELEEITAELEQQTEQAAAEAAADAGVGEDRPEDGGPERGGPVPGDGAAEATGIDWDAEPDELDAAGDRAADPTGGAQEEGDGDDAGGASGGDGGPTRAGEGGPPSDGAADATAEPAGGEQVGAARGEEAADGDAVAEEDLELDLTDPSEGEDQLLEPEEREVGEDGEAEVLGDDGNEQAGAGDTESGAADGQADEDNGDGGPEEEREEDEDGDGQGGDVGDGDHGVPDSL